MSKEKSDLDEFEEMVRARSKIQPELIEVLKFKHASGKRLEASAFLRVTGLLASAGFSLWRAAFLFSYAVFGERSLVDTKAATQPRAFFGVGFFSNKVHGSCSTKFGEQRSPGLSATNNGPRVTGANIYCLSPSKRLPCNNLSCCQ